MAYFSIVHFRRVSQSLLKIEHFTSTFLQTPEQMQGGGNPPGPPTSSAPTSHIFQHQHSRQVSYNPSLSL